MGVERGRLRKEKMAGGQDCFMNAFFSEEKPEGKGRLAAPWRFSDGEGEMRNGSERGWSRIGHYPPTQPHHWLGTVQAS